VEVGLFVLVSPFGFCLIALFFLVAGLLTPSSYERKGARRFVGDRLLRLGVPFLASYGSESGFSDLNLWEWLACVAVFGLGIVGSRQGWLETIPDHLARRCRTLTLFGVVAMATLLLLAGGFDAVDDAFGGWHWFASVFVVVEAVLTVFGSVWLFSVAQHRLNRHYRRGAMLSRSAYGAFMLQTVFLLALALILRPLALPAEVKAPVVAIGGIIAKFGAAWLLNKKVPGFSRVL
jgi:hypothetical protein